MLDSRGFVAETNATHLFLVDQGSVATSRTVACPEGITRAVVFDLCAELGIACVGRDVSLAELHRADELFCSGTMGELKPVVSVDGIQIGNGESGPLHQQLSEAFAQLTSTSGVRVVD